MRDILVYLLEKELEEEIRQLFSTEKYKLTFVEVLEDIAEVCQQEFFDLALVWPAGYEKTNNILTLLEINQLNYIPVIAVLKEDQTPDDFLYLPLVDLVRLPVSRPEFFAIIEQVLHDIDVQSSVVEGMNWQGSLEEYSLIDLIQMIEAGERDAELTMSYSDKSGSVLFHKGKIVKAEFLNLRGIDALAKFVFWSEGNFTTKLSELETVEDEIKKNNQEILMILVEKLLKQSQLYQGLPEPSEEVVKNPLAQPPELTPLQQKIAKLCAAPISIYNLLASLEDNNEDIMLELKIMMQMELVGRRQEIEAMVREEQERSGISKFFSSISSIFKKKAENEETPANYYSEFEDEMIPPQLTIRSLALEQEDFEKIGKKLEALS